MSTLVNECEPKVSFPMTVECVVTNPTTPTASNGSITLIINGGTPPYDVTWNNGNVGKEIINLKNGSYTATVVDYYGDYTIVKTCSLNSGPTPTPEPTPTPTPTPLPEYELCMKITLFLESNVITQIHFNPNGEFSGKPMWLSDDSVYSIKWDESIDSWKLYGSTYSITTPTTNYPPLTGWLLNGQNGEVMVTEGECVTESVTSINKTVTQPTCSCDGGITLNVTGGNPPFMYSVNNGDLYQNSPIFNNLCGGTYPIKIKDSLDNITSDVVVINNPQENVEYVITLSDSPVNTNTQTINDIIYTVTPSLPNGVKITFSYEISVSYIVSPTLNSFNYQEMAEIIIDGVTIPYTTKVVTDEVIINPYPNECPDNDVYLVVITYTWNNLELDGVSTFKSRYNLKLNNQCSSSTSSSGLMVNGFGFDLGNTQFDCCYGKFEISYGKILTPVINCQCCTVKNWTYFYNRS